MIYQQTPDFYNEYISHSAVWEGRSMYRNGEDELEHGWVKDAAAKAHKYIDRWRGKNGKWYYKYKQTLTNLKGRYRTRNGGRTNIDLEERENDRGYSSSRSRGDQIYGSRNAKLGLSFMAPVKGSSDHGNSRSYSKQGVDRAILAGRKRATKKGYKVKGYTGNLTSRGYTGSRGQASNNKATSKALSRREHMDYLKKNRSIKGGKAGLVNPNEPKRYTRRTERAHKEALKRDEEFIKYLTEAANYSSSRKKRK